MWIKLSKKKRCGVFLSSGESYSTVNSDMQDLNRLEENIGGDDLRDDRQCLGILLGMTNRSGWVAMI